MTTANVSLTANRLASILWNEGKANGGGTLNVDGVAPDTGYAVAIDGHEARVSALSQVAAYVESKLAYLLADADRVLHLGCWMSGGKLVLDLVHVLPTSVGDDAAVEVGRINSQEAVWHIETQRELSC